jgi:hypothetical protein
MKYKVALTIVIGLTAVAVLGAVAFSIVAGVASNDSSSREKEVAEKTNTTGSSPTYEERAANAAGDVGRLDASTANGASPALLPCETHYPLPCETESERELGFLLRGRAGYDDE